MAKESRFEVRMDQEFKSRAMEVAKSKGFAGLAGFIRFLLTEEVGKHEAKNKGEGKENEN